MYTNQAQALSAALSSTGNQRAAQEMMQVLANCNQPLTTRGPVDVNTAAQRRPPRAGLVYTPPNIGPVNQSRPTGNTLGDYYRNGLGGQASWANYGSSTWSPRGGGPVFSNQGNYWGGDTAYGGNYLTTGGAITNNSFVNNVLNNFNEGDTYLTNIDNSVTGGNVSNWYSSVFNDNGTYDFSTNINSTANYFTSTINNIEGNTYLQNQYVTDNSVNNNVVNHGDVINNSTVINEGDVFFNNNVYYNNNVYLNAENTFITNDNDIFTSIINLIQTGGNFRQRNILLFGRVPFNYETLDIPSDACKGGKVTVSIPTNAISGGSISLPSLSVTVSGFAAPGTYSVDPSSCSVSIPDAGSQTFTIDPAGATIALEGTPATSESQTIDLEPEEASTESIQYVARIFPQPSTSVTVLTP